MCSMKSFSEIKIKGFKNEKCKHLCESMMFSISGFLNENSYLAPNKLRKETLPTDGLVIERSFPGLNLVQPPVKSSREKV